MTHPLPAAIDALYALLKGLPDLSSVRIDDGPPQTDLEDPDAIGVALSVQEITAASGTVSRGLGYREDLLDVGCVIECWTGDATQLPERRARAYALLDIVDAALESDRQLGGTVTAASVVRHAYQPFQDKGGTGALINFTVRVEARRRR